jgi:hypothetical protein
MAAASPLGWLATFSQVTAWPHTSVPIAAVVLNLPFFAALYLFLSGKSPATAKDRELLALSIWATLIAAAVAYSRGQSPELRAGVPSRYVDFLVLLPVANVLWIVRMFPWVPVQWSRTARITCIAWGFFLAIGWIGLNAQVWRGLILPRLAEPSKPIEMMVEFQNTREDSIFDGVWRMYVPFPNMKTIGEVLDDSRLRGHLPPSLQTNEHIGFLSATVRTVQRFSTWIFGAMALTSAGLFGWSIVAHRKPEVRQPIPDPES